ncbi:NAD(+) diphosphatase [Microbacterium sp. YY-01]|uniref:NAD(+) diphosphatase n=1 Tax=Microbacterium sp. YY-01 TaxID=3421634 RepID=UPI003D17A55E
MSTQPWAFDRVAGERDDTELVARSLQHPEARVIIVRAGKTPWRDGPVLFTAQEARRILGDTGSADSTPAEDVQWAFLGHLSSKTPVLLAALAEEHMLSSEHDLGDDEWGGVRDSANLSAEHAELLVTAVSLAAWLVRNTYCSSCGRQLETQQSGWSRRCDHCRREFFPRTDPAVIVAVRSSDGDKLLLGANAAWRGEMYSCFAGFVEAGESLETTVHREIAEEAGVRLSDVAYLSSQPWPFPHSLMVGFHAVAIDDSAAHGDGDEIIAVRWLTRAEIGSALRGDGPVGLPGPASIARTLIEDWYHRGGGENQGEVA